MLDNIQDHKKHSFRKGAALQTELKRAMHIEENTISILLIEWIHFISSLPKK